VQRYIRAANPPPVYLDRTPMPPEGPGGVSQRRIADALGLPVETVRRHVNALIATGDVVEHRRGHLNTSPGRLELLAADGIPRAAAARTLAVANLMLRLGAAGIED
jgi:DNA-binding IclR family transcriptional regulator